jgi:hypothetical protein
MKSQTPCIQYIYTSELTINLHLPDSLRNLLRETAGRLRALNPKPGKKLREGLEVIEKMSVERKGGLCLSRKEGEAALETAATLAYMLSAARQHFEPMPLAVIVLAEIAPLHLTRRSLPPSSQVWGLEELPHGVVFNYETLREVLKSRNGDIPVAKGYILAHAIKRLEAMDPAVADLRDDLTEGVQTYAHAMGQLPAGRGSFRVFSRPSRGVALKLMDLTGTIFRPWRDFSRDK